MTRWPSLEVMRRDAEDALDELSRPMLDGRYSNGVTFTKDYVDAMAATPEMISAWERRFGLTSSWKTCGGIDRLHWKRDV